MKVCKILTKHIETEYFPEHPPGQAHPQLLAVEHQGVFYKLLIDTFHLHQHITSLQKTSEHCHDVFHIVLYRAGDNAFRLDGRQVQSHPNLLVLIHPGMVHSFTPLLPGETIYHEITFCFSAQGQRLTVPFADLFRKYYGEAIKSDKAVITLDASSAAHLEESYIELDKALYNYDSTRSFPVYRALEHLFEALFQKVFCPKHEESPRSHIEAKLQESRRHIECKLRSKLCLKELAAIAGMSPEHFCREFKKAYGEPPLEMRNRLRINVAMKLIQYSDYSIKEIAEELGYSDIYHFSKVFKKTSGLPPGKFRNQKF
ncbi:MAG: helix-turn-helix domain-containing protein [Victivallales bacterium]|nr:helix-turn-helix domain-containing protein [Victivallales bacterium]